MLGTSIGDVVGSVYVWREKGRVFFRALVRSRNVIVLGHGVAEIG